MGPGEALVAVGPSAALSLAVLLAIHQPWRPTPRSRGGRAAIGALAAAAALLLAVLCLGYWRGLWPTEAHARTPLAAIVVAIAEAAACLSGRRAVRLGVRAAAAVVAVWMLGWPLLGGIPPVARAVVWMPALGAAVLAWWVLVDALAGREPGPTLPLLLWLSASAASMLLLFGAHFISQSLLAAGIAGVAGALAVCAWWRPTVSGQGPAGVIAALLGCGLMLGYLAQGLPLWMIGLDALVPFCVLIRRLPPAARLRPWAATLACVTAGLLLVAPPIALAFREYMASPY